MPGVKVREQESFEEAYRRFKNKLTAIWLLQNVAHEGF